MTSADTDPAAHPDARSVVLRYLGALRERDLATLAEVLAPDAAYRIPGDHPVAGVWTGPQEISEKFFAPMAERFDPGAEYAVDVAHVVAEGSEVVVECVTRGTTVDGAPYRADISAHFTVTDGRITSMREFFDTQYFARTLFGVGSGA
ncbi:nuclear transport factor 2 family protein [Streptomyces sp. 6N223]|uniref:nuclear transport factor 2 family protein n=1 Tax=Streptomyces sp. 6N223 TaxID=3457412 RepID=UPI003FCFCE64